MIGLFSFLDRLKKMAYTLPNPRESRDWYNLNLSLSIPINFNLKIKLNAIHANEKHGFIGNTDWLLASKYYRGYGSVMDNYTQFLSFNLTHSPRKNFYYNFKLSSYSYLFNQTKRLYKYHRSWCRLCSNAMGFHGDILVFLMSHLINTALHIK